MEKQNNELSLDDTWAIKGIALLLLLAHHLFSSNGGFLPHPIILEIGRVGKVCVSLFVFLSGYGLTKSWVAGKSHNLAQFYCKHYIKLYFNYWFWWLFFVPLGFLCFHYTLTGIYGDKHTILGFIIDLLGLATAFKTPTVNPTWWFYSCILLFYTLFPLLVRMVKNKISAILLFLFSILIWKSSFPGGWMTFYLISFVSGSIFAYYNLFDKICSLKVNTWGMSIILVILIGLYRQSGYRYAGGYVDFLLSFSIINAYLKICKIKYVNKIGGGKKTLIFLGKHSFNIFLFHTFIYYLYFPEFIYWSKNPLIIFLLLLGSTLLISVMAEYLKKIIGFYKVQNRLINWFK